MFNRIYEEWKPNNDSFVFQQIHVQSNLWGMETAEAVSRLKRMILVQSNLWGMETMISWEDIESFIPVQSNLWGMETQKERHDEQQREEVQSNLWGMETRSRELPFFQLLMFNRIYEEWKHFDTFLFARFGKRSIESMRNGNRDPRRAQNGCASSFNRIYEEWKLACNAVALNCKPRFNRIYEEWKQFNDGSGRGVGSQFNRIYEEWKLPQTLKDALVRDPVQSNLWGMETFV